MKNLEEIDSKSLPYNITTIVIAVVSFIFLMFTQIYFIDQGEIAIVTNFGKISIGKISATIIPVIMMVATLLNTASTPRCSEFLVDNGTIRL